MTNAQDVGAKSRHANEHSGVYLDITDSRGYAVRPLIGLICLLFLLI
jgi:hypothetical protein